MPQTPQVRLAGERRGIWSDCSDERWRGVAGSVANGGSSGAGILLNHRTESRKATPLGQGRYASGVDEIYFDHASTTPPLPEAIAAAGAAASELFADPSRLYGRARRARIALDEARAKVGNCLGVRPEELVFTSGGTESCNLAIAGGARSVRAARRPERVLVSAVEHTAVL